MKQDGMAMVEALVASALLGLGLLGATRLTLHALDAALQTRQEMHAHALVAEALDCAVAHLQPCPNPTQRQYQGMTYTLEITRQPVDALLTHIQVRVQWSSQSTGPRQEFSGYTRVSAMPDGLGVSSP
jgi:Tfp pilus assembly protein PilV